MEYRIENEYICLVVKNKGAEMKSLVNKETGIEHLWQGDAAFWIGQAPILFPIVGQLKEGKTIINGKTYMMPRHGVLRQHPTILHHKTASILVLMQEANHQTLAQYPFQYAISIGFELCGKTLINSFEISNKSSTEMPFNIGCHPAFRIPFLPNETITDYYLYFEKTENVHNYLLNKNGLFSGESTPRLRHSNELAITQELFDYDALVFKDLKSREVQLRCRNNEHSVTVQFDAWPYLGIWAKPAAPFVCIEPWIGCADLQDFTGEMKEKEHIIILKPNETKRFYIQYMLS